MKDSMLSVIIPCYNCAATLEEAVSSVYKQDIQTPFEVVMVDDGSTDTTKEVMSLLSSRYQNITCIYHDTNHGGGAARNTAMRHTKGEVIFCLDSDDILPPTTLSKMYNFLLENNCDAVGIHRSIKFNGTNIKDVQVVHNFGWVGETIPFDSLVQKPSEPYCSLYSTFMHTRKVFDVTGGYPEDNGFDTQSFAWRTLANGFIAKTCPDAEYLHRINFQKSYFVREAEGGRVNLNWFKIFDEFLFLFNDEAKHVLLSFKFNDYTKNIYELLKKIDSPFVKNLEKYTVRHCKDNKIQEIIKEKSEKDQTKFDLYWVGSEFLRRGNFLEAEKFLRLSKRKGFTYPIIEEKLLLCELCLSGKNLLEEQKKIDLTKQKMLPLWKQFFKAVKNILKKIKKELLKYPKFDFLYCLFLRIKYLVTETKKKKEYYAQIESIKKNKKIVLDITNGGIGDFLVFSTLPRLLKQKYNVDFYLSRNSLYILRNKDTLDLCFTMNPYFKGISDDTDTFKLQIFHSEMSMRTLLLNNEGKTVLEVLEQQFGVTDKGIPEIYYKPNKLKHYSNIILVDKNTITGELSGWKYKENIFEDVAHKYKLAEDVIEYVDPKKQNLFEYVDMIYSCKHFIGTFSGGASIAACFDKPFSVIWPYNAITGTNYNFRYKQSAGEYVK